MTIRSETCLHSAANECDVVLGRALLQRGAKIFARDASGFTALHTLAAACASSSSESSQWTEFASMLVEKDKRILSARSSNGCTHLQIFVKSQSRPKNLKFLKYLLEESRDLVSWCDNIGRNVIHDAARRGVKEVMALIIDNINRKDLLYRKSSRERWNALHFSVRCGKVEMARFLTMYDIETEKLANARDRSGRTPLFLASSDSMRVALKKNLWSAALNGSVEDLRTALREFKFGGRREDQSTDLGPASRLALQTSLGPLSVTIRQNQTASHLAVLGKSKHVRQKLILLKEYDESCVDLKDANGRTPLMIISRKGNLQAVKCLVRFQCDLNACDKRGNTALHYASAYGHMNVVKLLKQSGADSSLKNHDGDTAADVAGGENSMVPDGLDCDFFENMDEKVADDEDDDRASGRRGGRGTRKNREKSGSDDGSYDSGFEDDE